MLSLDGDIYFILFLIYVNCVNNWINYLYTIQFNSSTPFVYLFVCLNLKVEREREKEKKQELKRIIIYSEEKRANYV